MLNIRIEAGVEVRAAYRTPTIYYPAKIIPALHIVKKNLRNISKWQSTLVPIYMMQN
jgi:hypothetical protein